MGIKSVTAPPIFSPPAVALPESPQSRPSSLHLPPSQPLARSWTSHPHPSSPSLLIFPSALHRQPDSFLSNAPWLCRARLNPLHRPSFGKICPVHGGLPLSLRPEPPRSRPKQPLPKPKPKLSPTAIPSPTPSSSVAHHQPAPDVHLSAALCLRHGPAAAAVAATSCPACHWRRSWAGWTQTAHCAPQEPV